MRNKALAAIFTSIADLMEILGEDRFRINSYRKAARAIENTTESIVTLTEQGRLQEIAGIGKSIAAKIEEFLKTGKVELHEQLMGKLPPSLPALLNVAGLGPKTVAKLWRQANVTSREELLEAMETQPERLTTVEGIGPKKIRQLWMSLQFLAGAGERIRLGEADILASSLVDAVAATKGARRVTVAGSIRRGKETIGDIDILCQASKATAPKIIAAFASADGVKQVRAKGDTKGSVLLDGDVQVDLRVVEKESFGAALAYFTGSKEHNIHLRELAIKKGLKLNEYGLFDGDKQVAGPDEQGVYEALALAFVPPELREDRGEIAAAMSGELPKLVESGNIRGDMHMHTTASDGENSIVEMIEACRSRGYKYMAICDHSKSQVQANGLDEKRLAKHAAAIRAAGAKYDDIIVLAGVEVDIFKDGSLDLEANSLGELDFVVASPHSALKMSGPEATERLICAIQSGRVHCIGHPTGRLINSRPAMEIDIEKLAVAAAKHNVALEINSHYMRLDLRDIHVRAAIAAGAKIIINTDAHSTADLDLMHYGVTTARRGWAEAKDIINTFTPQKFNKWLAAR